MNTINQHFEQLGFPIAQQAWSWGSNNAQAVMLKVWQQDCLHVDGDSELVKLLSFEHHPTDKANSLFQKARHQRLQHINQVLAGSDCYLVLCQSDHGFDEELGKQTLSEFERTKVLLGGQIRMLHDGIYIEVEGSIPSLELVRLNSIH